MSSLLAQRFVANLASQEVRADSRLIVAVSGGMDSTVLLHLLRFHTSFDLLVAHYDHAMRSSSDSDAAWVSGLCRAWSVPLVRSRTKTQIRNETGARDARYAFLLELVRDTSHSLVLTAHHADDQAETVLFRMARGGGLNGLRGIRARNDRGIVRPLLPFWRTELRQYAIASHLRWRTDPTNRERGATRNRIRLDILPLLEKAVPGASASLVALAELADESESGWDHLSATAFADAFRWEAGDLIADRAILRGYPPALASRLVRQALESVGVEPTRVGTRLAMQFITDSLSGKEISLGNATSLHAEFGVARFVRRRDSSPADITAALPQIAEGECFSREVRLGGWPYRLVAVRGEKPPDRGQTPVWETCVSVPGGHFPLQIRGRRAGDRIRTAGGSKTLKRLMIERRIPKSDRARRPILVDVHGTVLWVAGCETALHDSKDAVKLNIAISHG